MAAPRSTSLRALRTLSQQHSATPSLRRGLHITGVNSAQPANVADRASLYTAQSVPDLKQECQRRSLRAIGSKTEVRHCLIYVYYQIHLQGAINKLTHTNIARGTPFQP